MSQDASLGPPLNAEDSASSSDTAATAGLQQSSSPSPVHLVPAVQRSFQSLMQAIFAPNTGATELNQHVTSLITASKQLDGYLHSWTDSSTQCAEAGVGVEQRLLADVSELELELREKQRLLAHYTGRMNEWAERYRQLEASNEEVNDAIYAIHDSSST